MTEHAEQPFNPDLPKLFANYVTWWNAIPEDEKEDVTPVFEFYMPVDGEPYPGLPGNVYVNGYHTITYGHLLELVRRAAYAEATRAQLADACANWRGKYEDVRAKLEAVRAATTEWHQYAIGEGRDIDPNQVAIAGHALAQVLHALNGDAADPETGDTE